MVSQFGVRELLPKQYLIVPISFSPTCVFNTFRKFCVILHCNVSKLCIDSVHESWVGLPSDQLPSGVRTQKISPSSAMDLRQFLPSGSAKFFKHAIAPQAAGRPKPLKLLKGSATSVGVLCMG
jgi:hypothetical protein